MKRKLAVMLFASAALAAQAGLAAANPSDASLANPRVTQSAEEGTAGKTGDFFRGPGSPWYEGGP